MSNLKVYSIESKKISSVEVLKVGTMTLNSSGISGAGALTCDSIAGTSAGSHPYVNNLPAWSIYRNYTTTASITVTSANYQITSYDTTQYNWNSMANLTTGVVTIPVTGLYQLDAHIAISHTSVSHFDTLFYVNGVGKEPTVVVDKVGNWMTGNNHMCMLLTAGDQVSYGWSACNYTSGTLTSVALRHNFSGFLIKRL